MLKLNIKIFLLTSIFSTQLSLISFAMEDENDANQGPPPSVSTRQINYGNGGWIDPEEDLNPEETRREKMKLMKELCDEIQICERVLSTGQAEPPYGSFVRELVQSDLTKHKKHVERLREKLEELGGVNPPRSDDEEETNGEDDYIKEISERALRKGLLIPEGVDPREVEGKINAYDPSQEELEDERDRRREIYENSDSE
jgi:hypothetical protein